MPTVNTLSRSRFSSSILSSSVSSSPYLRQATSFFDTFSICGLIPNAAVKKTLDRAASISAAAYQTSVSCVARGLNTVVVPVRGFPVGIAVPPF